MAVTFGAILASPRASATQLGLFRRPPVSKAPQQILDPVYAFAPNRDTLGGTAYFILKNQGNILVDCPGWNEQTQTFLAAQGGVRWWVLTHRQGIGKSIKAMQAYLNCEMVMQEQEAYLLPELPVTSFGHTLALTPECRLLWTPGHSPGSACLHLADQGGILFSGRHLLPDPQGQLMPLRSAKTFHWGRQLQSLQRLLDEFTPDTLHYVCPGANIGFLRGQSWVSHAYAQLQSLNPG
nr:MBL fold metallo-hydrolase [Petrachloros mirabilis]